MTEGEWLACIDPARMLRFLRDKASDRKLRLFAVACCRTVPGCLDTEACRAAVETAERFADGQASAEELRQAGACLSTLRAAACATRADAAEAAEFAAFSSSFRPAWVASRQAALIRDIFPLFHSPHMDDAWLAWNDGAVRKAARAIYDGRAFDRVPLLADALEEAGCADAAILGHCRGDGEHVRGCWVVDLALGNG